MLDERFVLPSYDARYPPQLLETPEPPAVLYVRGNPAALGLGVAVIGARRASPTGLAITRLLTSAAAAAGYPIVSGAAVGCDQAAHSAALESGGLTVAVLGSGADVVYPRSAGPVLERILASGGAVVSEQPWGTQPRPWMFRRRNRIIAGLAAAVLVVEARRPSGTFSTADEALAAGRAVLAVPGSILSPHAQGPNALIRQGAVPITSPDDLLDELSVLIGPPRARALSSSSGPATEHETGVRRAILETLQALPAGIDELAASLRLAPAVVARSVSELEVERIVERGMDGRYHAVAKGGGAGGRIRR